jgi:hypothetical protein
MHPSAGFEIHLGKGAFPYLNRFSAVVLFAHKNSLLIFEKGLSIAFCVVQ